MNKRYLFVILGILIVAVVIFFVSPEVRRLIARQKTAGERREQERQDQILAESGISGAWVRTAQDEYPQILAGSNVTTDTLLKRTVVFKTSDTPSAVIGAYRAYGQKEKWILEQQKIVASGDQMLVFNTKQFGTLTVYIASAGSGSTVRLERLMIP